MTTVVPNTMLDSGSGLGYVTGHGGAVTQATSKGTGVTLNKPSGRVTMNGAALGAGATVTFTLTNSSVGENDSLVTTLSGSMGTMANYNVWNYVGAGYAIIAVKNISAGSLSDAPTINFALIKGAVA